MPEWTLICKCCNKTFTHTKIDVRSRMVPEDDSLWLDRREVPEYGLTAECPHCKNTALYRRVEFSYSPE
jgi:hypothetical protein